MSLRVTVRSAFGPLAAAMAVAAVVAPTLVASSAEAQARSNAQAEQSRSMRERIFGRSLPPTGRYVSESGEGFIWDRTAATPLMRFDRSVETWALRGSAAPRGDILYRNDAGELILRVTADGGMTLYTRRAPSGSPVSLAGPGERLTPTTLGPVQMFSLMARRSALVSRSLGRLVEINVSGERSEALSVDALVVTTDTVMRMARSATARGYVSRLRSITITEGARASVTYAGGNLRVVVDPSRGPAGRPSSARIIQAFADAES
jgi:hypothetical protein